MGGKTATVTSAHVAAAFEWNVFPATNRRPMAKIKPRGVAAIAKAVEARGAGPTGTPARQTRPANGCCSLPGPCASRVREAGVANAAPRA
jgi:hypothetical protein